MSFSFLDKLSNDEGPMSEDTITQQEQPVPTEATIGDSTAIVSETAKAVTPAPELTKQASSSSRYSTASSGQSMSDVFDNIRCPNTFEENSQVERYFDSHYSTPSPKPRRSKRIARKNSGVTVANPKTKAPNSDVKQKGSAPAKTPPRTKGKTNTAGARIKASTPFTTPKGGQPLKLPTTPGPVHNPSLLKMALGNAARKHEPSGSAGQRRSPAAGQTKRRVGPRTSTPKQTIRNVNKTKVNLVKTGKDKTPPIIVEEPEASSRKKPVVKTTKGAGRPTIIHTTSVRPLRTREQVTKSTSVFLKPAAPAISPRRSVGLQNAGVSTTARTRRAQQGTGTGKQGQRPAPIGPSRPQSLRAAETKVTQRTISQRMAPPKGPDSRRSRKSIVKSRESTSSKTRSSVARGATRANAALTKGKAPLKNDKTEPASRRPVRGASSYSHIQSKVAQMINSGPAQPSATQLKDMKTAAQTAAAAKPSRKPLHSKPFLPAGKVHHETTFNVTSGNLTIAGQTMAQFVKNFHYQTPPRYRTLKPGENFQTTCENRKPTEANPTIPRAPRFATNARLRRTILKK